ncbi:acetyl esterase [Ureibacillus xyleni]|uniref:Acetyl esterase n=1 Tax=Ureibacillus xyleni TaxID=614648 RepID=A0A285RYP7_9BACL|nr:alpha/beta hydrolase [Ureibacillus xyleni]SOB99348.1 acetyl esterase [Ureibacillus xyleni]
MGLSNSAKVYLEAFYSGPKIQDLTPDVVRQAMIAPVPEGVEVPQVAKVENRQIPVNEGEITVRIYTPEGDGPFPLFVYYHGGGWVLGNLDTSDAGCRLLAENTKRVVVSVDYRLAPEFKYPVPVEDSYAALCWAHDHAEELNAIADDIVVGGDSAGGNLATIMTILSQENNGPSISAQALIYPVTNLDFTTASYEKFAEGFGLDKDLMIWFGEYYVNSEEDYKNVDVSPLLCEDVSALPPAVIVAAENDVLFDEGAEYRDKLKEAGVKVEYSVLPGSIHGFFSNMAVFADETKETVSAIAQFLNALKVNS